MKTLFLTFVLIIVICGNASAAGRSAVTAPQRYSAMEIYPLVMRQASSWDRSAQLIYVTARPEDFGFDGRSSRWAFRFTSANQNIATFSVNTAYPSSPIRISKDVKKPPICEDSIDLAHWTIDSPTACAIAKSNGLDAWLMKHPFFVQSYDGNWFELAANKRDGLFWLITCAAKPTPTAKKLDRIIMAISATDGHVIYCSTEPPSPNQPAPAQPQPKEDKTMASNPKSPPAPLFRDPIYDGAADPTIIWNREEKSWWIIYTNRRANVDGPRVGWVHGTDIGIASSADGKSWRYRGTLRGLEFENGRNTFWAPEVVYHDGKYHMFCSYVPGVPSDWSGRREIIHYTSANLWDWKMESRLKLSSDRVIDACVIRLSNGKWRMWYKDEVNGAHTYAADSDDLSTWRVTGPVITDRPHEGPNVFYWQGKYWMITDTWAGLGVYSSTDAEHWTMQKENILATPGKRPDDGAVGSHADVLVQGDDAYIFYFTHPQINQNIPETVPGVTPYAKRRSSLQVAKLQVVDGKLVCDRDAMSDFVLKAPKE